MKYPLNWHFRPESIGSFSVHVIYAVTCTINSVQCTLCIIVFCACYFRTINCIWILFHLFRMPFISSSEWSYYLLHWLQAYRLKCPSTFLLCTSFKQNTFENKSNYEICAKFAMNFISQWFKKDAQFKLFAIRICVVIQSIGVLHAY